MIFLSFLGLCASVIYLLGAVEDCYTIFLYGMLIININAFK